MACGHGFRARRCAAPGMTSVRDLAARFARALQIRLPLFERMAQGMPGARCTRGLLCQSRAGMTKSRARGYPSGRAQGRAPRDEVGGGGRNRRIAGWAKARLRPTIHQRTATLIGGHASAFALRATANKSPSPSCPPCSQLRTATATFFRLPRKLRRGSMFRKYGGM